MDLALSFLSGSLLSGVVLFLARSTLESRRAHLDRVERVTLAAFTFRNAMAASFIAWRGAMLGKYSVNEALDMVIADGKEINSKDVQYFFVSFRLYFPEMKKSFKAFELARDEQNAVIRHFKETYRRTGQASAEHASQFALSFGKFDNEFNEIVQLMVEEAAKARRLFGGALFV